MKRHWLRSAVPTVEQAIFWGAKVTIFNLSMTPQEEDDIFGQLQPLELIEERGRVPSQEELSGETASAAERRATEFEHAGRQLCCHVGQSHPEQLRCS
jgi:hypothetical protein